MFKISSCILSCSPPEAAHFLKQCHDLNSPFVHSAQLLSPVPVWQLLQHFILKCSIFLLLQESRSSLRRDTGLTRDVAVSRVVLSCMQTLASSCTPSSSSSSSLCSSSSTSRFKVNRQTTPSQKNCTPNSKCTRFNEYVQVGLFTDLGFINVYLDDQLCRFFLITPLVLQTRGVIPNPNICSLQ